ncbi:unnamed protein product, partial [Porites lobata]
KTSRKRKRAKEETCDVHIPESVIFSCDINIGKKRKKKGKSAKRKEKRRRLAEARKQKVNHGQEDLFTAENSQLQPTVNPYTEHLFQAGNVHHALSPVKISSIPELILFALTPDDAVVPDWCDIMNVRSIQKVVIVLVSGIGAVEFNKHQEHFSQCNTLFEKCVATFASGPDISVRLPPESLLSVDISKQEKKRRKQAKQNADTPKGREDYILTTEEMQMNDYPLPEDDDNHADYKSTHNHGFISTKAYQKSTSTSNESSSHESPMYAVDCEMCETAEGLELTRISVVDESFNVIYDTLVKPARPIIDYKTKFSGITKKTLENVTTTLDDVQKCLIDLLPHDAILIGHSLENDLRALKLHHRRVIDTSVLYDSSSGPLFKSSLKCLTKQFLNKKIQNGSDGHCSIEDAKACMELVQLKIKNGPNFGKPSMNKEGYANLVQNIHTDGAMLDSPGVLRKFCSGARHAVSCTSDHEVVSQAVELVKTADLLWAHLHQPEMFLKGETCNDKGEEDQRWKEVLKSVDSKILQIHQALPKDTLFFVMFGCGDLSLVTRQVVILCNFRYRTSYLATLKWNLEPVSYYNV